MMGRRRKIPETAQLSFLTPGKMKATRPVASPAASDRFLQGDPESIFFGEMSLRRYLNKADKGWVIRFRELLFKQDAGPFLNAYKSLGRKPYHPLVMLGLILYGAQQGRWSLRELEDLAKLDLGAWWICGGLQPDHSTIGDFINLHSEILTEEFFVSLTRDLVGRLGASRGAVAGDGTVVEAVSSRISMLKQEAAQSALAKAEQESGPDSDQANCLREALETVVSRGRKRQAKGRDKHAAKVCPNEPEAVLQPRKDGVNRPSYKPSVLADTHRLILGQHVDGSSEMAAVSPMLEQYRNVFGDLPTTSLWDGNYNKFELLRLSVSEEMDCLCNTAPMPSTKKRNRFQKVDFLYDAGADVYRCPAGNLLVYRKSGYLKDRPYREYQCRDCGGCESRNRCTKSKAGRSVIRYEGEELKEAMREVMAHPVARKRLAFRKAMVEPVFGDLAYRQGLRRFHRRGLRKVRVEFSLHCMAYNLRRTVRLAEAAGGCICVFSGAENGPYGICGLIVVFYGTEDGSGFIAVGKWKLC